MNIYEKIFARLEELHMSQIELSRRTGIATSTISDWRKKNAKYFVEIGVDAEDYYRIIDQYYLCDLVLTNNERW